MKILLGVIISSTLAVFPSCKKEGKPLPVPGAKAPSFTNKTLEPVSLVRFTSWFFSHWNAGIDILEGLDEQGVWSKVILLPKGRYEYFILIDPGFISRNKSEQLERINRSQR